MVRKKTSDDSSVRPVRYVKKTGVKNDRWQENQEKPVRRPIARPGKPARGANIPWAISLIM
jgi:hypothetical protein